MRRILALLICASVTVYAQAPVRDAGPASAARLPAGGAGISGVVKDQADQPIRRALVTIAGDGFTRSLVTDDEGRFAFTNLPAGRFTIQAAKPAYPSMSYGANRPYRPGPGLTLAADQQAGGVVLKLGRGAALSGTVFDELGKPMPGVPVMAWEVRTALSGERTLDFPTNFGEAVTTDDRGMYRIFGLAPGEYTVGTSWSYRGMNGDVRMPTDAEYREAFRAVAEPASPAVLPAAGQPARAPVEPPGLNYAPVFYPDSVDALAAMTLPLKAGDEREGIDLRMQLRPMSKIEADIVGLEPGVRAEVILSRRSRVAALNSTSFSAPQLDGHYTSSSLGPGDYSLRARVQAAPGKPAQWAQSDVSIAGSEPVRVTLRLEPTLTVSGRLVFEAGTLPPPEDLTKVRISVIGPGTEGNIVNTTPAINADGTFTYPGFVPGSYRLATNIPGAAAGSGPSWSMRAAMQGNRDTTDLPIEIAPGDVPPLTIVFSDTTAELSGALTTGGGAPAPDYFVILLPADHRYWVAGSRRITSTRPDVKGRYVFRNVPAGEYRLAVTTDLILRDLADTGALARLEEQSTPVSIAFGEKKVFDVKLGR